MIVVSDVKIHSKMPITEANDIPSISPAEKVWLKEIYEKLILPAPPISESNWVLEYSSHSRLTLVIRSRNKVYDSDRKKMSSLTEVKHHRGHNHWVTVFFPAPLRVILPILDCFMMSANAFLGLKNQIMCKILDRQGIVHRTGHENLYRRVNFDRIS